MLIALVGPASAGKLEVAKYLVVHHNFRPAFIRASSSTDASLCSANDQIRQWQALVPLCQNSASSTEKQPPQQQNETTYMFEDRQALLDHSTAHWRDNIVTLDLANRVDLECGFDKRPFFLLVGVDAPVLVRWRRSQALHGAQSSSVSLESFLEADDGQLYGASAGSYLSAKPVAHPSQSNSSLPTTPVKQTQMGSMADVNGRLASFDLHSSPSPVTPLSQGTSTLLHQVVQPNGLLASRAASSSSLRELMQACTLVIHNPFDTVSALHTHLAALQLSSAHRLRPSWDTYFLSLCTLASLRSNCMKRRVGAVLVRSNRVLSTGYNGTPRGLLNCAEGGCARCNGAAAGGTALDECLCLHAEENALLECGRERGGAEGTVLYCNTCPCLRCAVKIVQTGVREVVYQLAYSMDDRSRQIFREANVVFRQHLPM